MSDLWSKNYQLDFNQVFQSWRPFSFASCCCLSCWESLAPTMRIRKTKFIAFCSIYLNSCLCNKIKCENRLEKTFLARKVPHDSLIGREIFAWSYLCNFSICKLFCSRCHTVLELNKKRNMKWLWWIGAVVAERRPVITSGPGFYDCGSVITGNDLIFASSSFEL